MGRSSSVGSDDARTIIHDSTVIISWVFTFVTFHSSGEVLIVALEFFIFNINLQFFLCFFNLLCRKSNLVLN